MNLHLRRTGHHPFDSIDDKTYLYKFSTTKKIIIPSPIYNILIIQKLEGKQCSKQCRSRGGDSLYRKNSKIWDTSSSCHNCPKNRKVLCNIALMHPKDADGMANSVDPDQTAEAV